MDRRDGLECSSVRRHTFGISPDVLSLLIGEQLRPMQDRSPVDDEVRNSRLFAFVRFAMH